MATLAKRAKMSYTDNGEFVEEAREAFRQSLAKAKTYDLVCTHLRTKFQPHS